MRVRDLSGVQGFAVAAANRCGSIVSDYPCGAIRWGAVKLSACLAESDTCIPAR